MNELHDYSERLVRAGIAAIPDGSYTAEDVLEAPEGDLPIRVKVTVRGDEVELDLDLAARHGLGAGALPGQMPVPAKVTLDVSVGDVITIETPGGGGFGAPRR